MAPTFVKPAHLAIADYYAKAEETDRFRNEPDGLTQLGFGFFGELGGLLSALKKVSRDTLLETESVFAAEELGDALWYLVSLASHVGVDPNALGRACLLTLREAFGESMLEPNSDVTFEEVDGLVDLHRTKLNGQREPLLRKLAAASGELTGVLQSDLRAWEPQKKAKRLGALMANLAEVSGHFGLGLSGIARENLKKIKDRWPGKDRQYIPLFDMRSKAYECLPRQFDIEFIARQVAGRSVVVQQMRGVNIGDPLTDNSHTPDGYRFHDVFHLAYVAHLGWSPVIRALLKLKRKSEPKIDENEDGARAIIIEEGIATWIFNHAAKRNFYAGLEDGRLEYGLLKQVHSMVQGYRVQECPSWQWEQAILRGFDVFRQLLANDGGTVKVDMEAHSIAYEPPSESRAS